MPPTPARRAPIDPATLPPALRARIESAIELGRREVARIPEADRIRSMELRKLTRAEASTEASGCGVFVVAFGVAKLLDVTWAGAFVLAMLLGFAASGVRWTLGPLGPSRRDLRHRSPALLAAAAAEFAGFGEVEWAAIAAASAPRAGAELRAEIDRLLAEDARLAAAVGAIDPRDADPVEADRLRLRLALARETDPATRQALEASLALCERRVAAVQAEATVRARIAAHRELILQTLRAAGDGLASSTGGAAGGATPEELALVRESAASLGGEVAAIEAAVQGDARPLAARLLVPFS